MSNLFFSPLKKQTRWGDIVTLKVGCIAYCWVKIA